MDSDSVLVKIEKDGAIPSIRWLIKDFIDSSLGKSIHEISGLISRDQAVSICWEALRPGEKMPKKSITKTQKRAFLDIADFSIAENEKIKKNLRERFKNSEFLSKALDNNSYDGTGFHTYTSEPSWLNDWTRANDNITRELKRLFLADYLSTCADFRNILTDPKALICSDSRCMNSSNTSWVGLKESKPVTNMFEAVRHEPMIIEVFADIYIYAYLGLIVPKGEGGAARAFDMLMQYRREFLSRGFLREEPLFLNHAASAARARRCLDEEEGLFFEDLVILAGVDRKTAINAKLTESGFVDPHKALDFLSKKARNRWNITDDSGFPMGPKYLSAYSGSGIPGGFQRRSFSNYHPTPESIVKSFKRHKGKHFTLAKE